MDSKKDGDGKMEHSNAYGVNKIKSIKVSVY